MYTKYILNKDEVVTIISLLTALKKEVVDLKDTKTKNKILDFMYEILVPMMLHYLIV